MHPHVGAVKPLVNHARNQLPVLAQANACHAVKARQTRNQGPDKLEYGLSIKIKNTLIAWHILIAHWETPDAKKPQGKPCGWMGEMNLKAAVL
jgi:hypothetical protein